MRVAFGIGAAAAILVGGCRQSEEDVLAELRHQMMQRCSADMAAAVKANPGFDTQQFCGCLTDKAFAGRNVVQVRELFEDREKMVAAAREAALACRPANSPDLPPISLDEAPPASQNNSQNRQNSAAERPRRNGAAPRPRSPPAPGRPRQDGPIATPTPVPQAPPRPSPPPPAPTPPPPAPSPTPPPPLSRA